MAEPLRPGGPGWPAAPVVTGEAVALDLHPAAVPSRAVARLLDLLCQATVLSVLAALAGVVAAATSTAAAAAVAVAVTVLVLIGYPVAFETLLRGRTPGKAALGLRVVRDDGGPIGFRQALVRGMTGALLDVPTLGVTAVVPSLLNRRHKRLGDLLAGTVVLRERVPAAGGPVAVAPAELAPWAASLDLSGLPDDLARSARQFVARSPSLTAAARDDLGGRLAAAVLSAVTPPPPAGTPGWAVLATVLAERRRREEHRLSQAVRAAGVQPVEPQAVAPPVPPTPPAPSPPPVSGFAPPG